MTDPIEVELKLEFDPADRDGLASAAPLADAEAHDEHLVATYFDTPARDLRKAGYSLRIRSERGVRVQTIKAFENAAGLFARAEWECEVKGDSPVPDPASAPGEWIGRLEGLSRLFVTDVHRTTRAIEVAGTRLICGIDVGKVRAGRRAAALCEIELELVRGSPRPLFDLARRLNEQVPLRLSVLSKAERGFDLADGDADRAVKAEPIALDPHCNAGEAFQIIARSCLRQFRRNETILLASGASEPLHQARVGLRRLRTAFCLFKPLFTGDERARLLEEELRWLAIELGEVRNLDVLIAATGHKARSRLVAARQQRFARTREALGSARTRLLMIDLAEWLAFGDWREHPHDPRLLSEAAEHFASDVLDARLRQLKRRAKKLAASSDGRRHKARIAGKKLRYATQFFASLYRGEKDRRRLTPFSDALEALQDSLGELNDLVVGPKLLARLGIEASLPDGKRKREDLLDCAETSRKRLMDARHFWK